MKYQEEFCIPELVKKLFSEIASITTKNWAIMEVCSGQTHSIIRNGIDQLLPDKIELIHSPRFSRDRGSDSNGTETNDVCLNLLKRSLPLHNSVH